VIRFPKEFGRKLVKGFNVVDHWDELMGLREYVQGPWLMLVAGTIFATVLRMVGIWDKANALVVSVVPALAGIVNTQIIFLSVLTYFYLPLLAQNIFMSRSKSSKHNESFLCYFWRYLKGMVAVVIVPSIVYFVVFIGGIAAVVQPLVTLLQGPKTALNVVMLAGLSLVSLVMAICFLIATALMFALPTYAFAFALQGVGVKDALVRGIRLFMSQWVYTSGLLSLFLLLPMLIRVLLVVFGAQYVHILQAPLVGDIGTYLMMLSVLVYYTLFFAYHKRVSKIPSSR
jgi:hypothetical protein